MNSGQQSQEPYAIRFALIVVFQNYAVFGCASSRVRRERVLRLKEQTLPFKPARITENRKCVKRGT